MIAASPTSSKQQAHWRKQQAQLEIVNLLLNEMYGDGVNAIDEPRGETVLMKVAGAHHSLENPEMVEVLFIFKSHVINISIF